jgi:hypothetical protein
MGLDTIPGYATDHRESLGGDTGPGYAVMHSTA